MFPLQQSDDMVYQIFSNSNQHKIPQDLIRDHASLEGTPIPIIGNSMGQSQRRKVCHMESTSTQAFTCDKYKKQKLHREIERQRRQDMASLYASLRSLLPGEYIKGKRSMSDHMNEAVNYIKHLEKKVKDLDVKRDELKRASNLAALGSETESSNQCFIIRPCLIGIEIMFRCGFEEQGLPLSRVLAALVDEGLPVVSCISTKSEEYLLHTIQTEVNDPTSFNLSGLQQKLAKHCIASSCSPNETARVGCRHITWTVAICISTFTLGNNGLSSKNS
ncbi:transcription factor bHLH118-like [Herrania umbratica]|uniref:Transcription factor bHLH118-like n=1 Tax=Herrania umbratica TaxID=108875 RepID=A0A6J1B5Z0_9ROSI|nr:transcription factor bHLH118-like [Herrania umbratica]